MTIPTPLPQTPFSSSSPSIAKNTSFQLKQLLLTRLVVCYFRDIPVDFKYIAEPSMHSMPAVALHPNSKFLLTACNQSPVVGSRSVGTFEKAGRRQVESPLVADPARRPRGFSIFPVMSSRKYMSVSFNFKSFIAVHLHSMWSLRSRDNPYTGQPTYHNSPHWPRVCNRLVSSRYYLNFGWEGIGRMRFVCARYDETTCSPLWIDDYR